MFTNEELKEALREVMKHQLKQFEELGDCDHEFSPRFERKMKPTVQALRAQGQDQTIFPKA